MDGRTYVKDKAVLYRVVSVNNKEKQRGRSMYGFHIDSGSTYDECGVHEQDLDTIADMVSLHLDAVTLDVLLEAIETRLNEMLPNERQEVRSEITERLHAA